MTAVANRFLFKFIRPIATGGLFSFVLACGAMAPAQDLVDQPPEDDTPEVIPQQESIKIEPYTGPPIFLPESADPPAATRVEEKSITDYYDTESKEKPRVVRNVRRYSDDSVKNHGEYKEYYEGGQLFAEGGYDEGVPVGEWKYFHADGTLAKTVTYVAGRPDGGARSLSSRWQAPGEAGVHGRRAQRRLDRIR